MVLEAAISGGCRYIVTFNNETSKQRIRCPYVSSHLKNSFEQSGLSNEHTQSRAAQLSPRRDQKMARRDGISINQPVSTAVAEKLAALMTEEHLEKRARRGSKPKVGPPF